MCICVYIYMYIHTACCLLPISIWLLVLAPLIPLVALVELPPQNADLSRRTVLGNREKHTIQEQAHSNIYAKRI